MDPPRPRFPPRGSRRPRPGSPAGADRRPCELQNGNNDEDGFGFVVLFGFRFFWFGFLFLFLFSTGKSSFLACPPRLLFAGAGWWCRGGQGDQRSLLLPRHRPCPHLREPVLAGASPGAGVYRGAKPRFRPAVPRKGSIRPCGAAGRCLGQCGGFSSSPAYAAPRSFQRVCWFCNT